MTALLPTLEKLYIIVPSDCDPEGTERKIRFGKHFLDRTQLGEWLGKNIGKAFQQKEGYFRQLNGSQWYQYILSDKSVVMNQVKEVPDWVLLSKEAGND